MRYNTYTKKFNSQGGTHMISINKVEKQLKKIGYLDLSTIHVAVKM